MAGALVKAVEGEAATKDEASAIIGRVEAERDAWRKVAEGERGRCDEAICDVPARAQCCLNTILNALDVIRALPAPALPSEGAEETG